MNTLFYNIIDIAMLCIIIYSSIIGYIKGIWRSGIYFFSWIMIIYSTYHIFYFTLPYIQANIGSSIIYSLTSLLIIAGIISILFTWFAESSAVWINNSNMMNWLDDLLGLFYGFIRGWIVLMLAWVIAKPVLLNSQIQDLNDNSKILPMLNMSVGLAQRATPLFITNWFNQNIYRPIQDNQLMQKILPSKLIKIIDEQNNQNIIEVNQKIINEEQLAPETTMPIIPPSYDNIKNMQREQTPILPESDLPDDIKLLQNQDKPPVMAN